MAEKPTTKDATLYFSKCVDCGVIFTAHKNMNHAFLMPWNGDKSELPNAFVSVKKEEGKMHVTEAPKIDPKLVEAVTKPQPVGRPPGDKPFNTTEFLDRFEDKGDPVNHPSHYTSSGAKCECGRTIECIDVVRHLGFNRGNSIKYLWRAGKKDETIQDLKKAIWYIQDEIKKLENEK